MPHYRGYQRRTVGIGLTLVVAVITAVVSLFPWGAAFAAGASDALSVPLEWQPVPGKAVDLSIDPEGEAYAVDAEGNVWHWRRDGQRWGPMSGKFVRIVGAAGNRPWAIDAKGGIYRYNGLWWEKKGEGGADVAADAKGDVLVADAKGGLRRWNPLSSEWSPVAGPGDAVRVALGPNGTAWTLDRQGRVRYDDGKRWVGPLGDVRGRDLAADADRRGWIVTWNGQLLAWQPDRSRWQAVPLPGGQPALTVAIAPDGKPWVVLRGGDIIAATRLGPPPKKDKEPKPSVPHASTPHAPTAQAPVEHAAEITPPSAVPTPVVPNPVVTAQAPSSIKSGNSGGKRTVYIDPATVTARGPFTFTDTRATAGTVAIGRDGSVFALAPGGAVMRWSNTYNKLESFPGQLVRLAVDPDGHPWGISALGRIFRHDGTRWKQVHGTASDIGIGADGTVIVASNTGGLYRLDAAGTAFTRIRGTGVIVAVDPDGQPWTIDGNGYVRRCTTIPCTNLGQKAISIAIGPDRSVFVVSERNVLRRYDATSGKFDRITIPRYTPKQVAVGPSGYPWVVTTGDELLSTHMFPRNETGDNLVARSTSGNTTGSGATATVTSTSAVSGFTFTKNMQFKTVGTDIFPSDAYVQLDAGNDGQIWAYGSSSSGFGIYNSNSNAFKSESTKLASDSYVVSNFAVDSNGDIWAYTTSPSTHLYREHNKSLQEYSVSGLTIGGVTVAPDDTVYAIFYTGGNYYLYKKTPADSKFTKFDNYALVSEVGVGPGGDVWIVDKNEYVREWNGSDFVKRPSGGQKASKIAVSENGTVYIADTSHVLRKWNGTNKSFDKVNNTSVYYLTVDSNGRPWIANTNIVKYGKD